MSKLLKILSIGVTLTSCGITMAVKNNDCNKDHKRAYNLVKTSGISKRYPKSSDTKRFIRTPQGIQRYLSSNEISKICMLIRQGHLSEASIHKLCDAIEFHMRGHNGYSNDYYGWNGHNGYYNNYDWGNWHSVPYYEDNACDGTCNSSNEIDKICMLIRQGHLSEASIHKLCDAIEFHMRGHNGYNNDYYGWNGYNSYYNNYDWGNWYSDPYYEDNTCDGTCNWYEYNNDYRGTYDWGTQDNGYNRHPYGYGCR